MLRKLSALSFGAIVGLLTPPALSAKDTALATPPRHHIQTVFIIVMENHNWTGDSVSIKGNPSAPFINNVLLPMASHAEQYFNPPSIHPSLPNYLWLEAGDNFGIFDDGPPKEHSLNTTKHLVTLLDTAGISWKAYLEDVSGAKCPLVDEGAIDQDGNALYAVKHDPFAYFNDVTDHRNAHSAKCIAHLRPFSELQDDLDNNAVSAFNWITPNMCDDMHDKCGGDPIANGDAWLQEHVPAILNSAVFQQGGALFITWDEGSTGDGPIGMILLSPFAKANGFSDSIHYTHGSTLRTMQEIFGVKPLLRDARQQQDLSNLFKVFP